MQNLILHIQALSHFWLMEQLLLMFLLLLQYNDPQK